MCLDGVAVHSVQTLLSQRGPSEELPLSAWLLLAEENGAISCNFSLVTKSRPGSSQPPFVVEQRRLSWLLFCFIFCTVSGGRGGVCCTQAWDGPEGHATPRTGGPRRRPHVPCAPGESTSFPGAAGSVTLQHPFPPPPVSSFQEPRAPGSVPGFLGTRFTWFVQEGLGQGVGA